MKNTIFFSFVLLTIRTTFVFGQVSITVDQVYQNGSRITGSSIYWLNNSNNLAPYTVPYTFSFTAASNQYFDASHQLYSLQKYNNWSFVTDVKTPLSYPVPGSPATILSKFDPPNYAILQNEFVDGLVPILGGGLIGFKDPWFKGDATFTDNASTPKNLGYSANYDYVSSTANSGSSRFHTFPGEAGSGNPDFYHNGVFLSQGTPGNWSTSPPYYAISPQPIMEGAYSDLFASVSPTHILAIGDLALTGFDLTNGTNADLYYYTSTGSDTAVVFTANNATVYPQYKAHLATSNDGLTSSSAVNTQAPGLPSNSQRAVVYCELYSSDYYYWDAFGGPFYAMIYIEHGMLYFSYSAVSDNGSGNSPGINWSQETRIDQSSSSGHPSGFVQNASICVRSDGHIGIVYADSNPDHIALGISSTQPIISLLDGTPQWSTFYGIVDGFTWNFNPSLNNADPSVILYSDNEAYTIQGKNPVIAPRILSTDPSGYPYNSGEPFSITNSGYWVTWVVDQSITGYLTNPGVYTAAASKSCSGAYCFATPNPYCVLPPRTALGGVIANNPSVSASFVDEPNFLNKTVLNSSEGDSLHVAWEYGNKIEYNTVKSTNAAGSSLQCTFTKTEEASTYTSAKNLVAPSYLYTYSAISTPLPFFQLTNSHPSLGVDDYIAADGNLYEEPVVAWQTSGWGIFYPSEGGLIPLTNFTAITMNRKGNNWLRSTNPLKPADWTNQTYPREFAEMYIVAPGVSTPYNYVDHPSVSTFPADDKTHMPNVPSCGNQTFSNIKKDLQAAIAFHLQGTNNIIYPQILNNLTKADYSVVACSYWNPLSVSTCLSPFQPRIYASLSSYGTVEQNVSYDKYNMTPYGSLFNPSGFIQENMIYKGSSPYTDIIGNTLPSGSATLKLYEYGFAQNNSENLGLGKEFTGTFDIGDTSVDYLATSVTFDTSGTSSILLGEITYLNGTDTISVPMNVIDADSSDTSFALSHYIRSAYFPFANGNSVSAAAYLMSDSVSIINMMHSTDSAIFSIDVVDSASGMALMPIYKIIIGGGDTTVNIPTTFPLNEYSGSSSSSACVRMLTTVTNTPDSLYGIAGLSVHSLSVDSAGGNLGKQIRHNTPPVAALLPTDQLSVYPNPTNAGTQIAYDLTQGGNVQVKIFDILGKQIKQVVNSAMTPGHYNSSFSTDDLQTGFYKIIVFVDDNIVASGDIIVRR